MLEDTIIAVSTPIGHGGLGIVRLSGRKSLSVAKKIFKPKKSGTKIMPRHPVLGNLYNHEQRDYFEEAFLTYFPRPYTYTREDMVEISCHGSPVILEQLVRLGIKEGARHADPGEFTLRAYLRGRIDIIQAEAVNDIIQAASYKQAKISFKQLEGSLSKQISALRDQIIQLLSQVEARIEFPDERLRISTKRTLKTLKNAIYSVNNLVESYDLGKTLAEGVTLVKKERAIVTPHPGTTRDFLKETISVKDSIFTLIDMAGLGSSLHPVEKEGIKRGKKLASQADGILLLLDVSCKETPEDFKLIKKFSGKQILLIFNKIDLPLKMNIERVKKQAGHIPNIEISALKGTNLKKLKDKIYKLFIPDLEQDNEIILHLRQKLILEEILDSLIEGQNLLKQGYPEEIYAEEIRKAIPLIGQLTGEIRADDIINDIFSRFCVGK
jgi:tRNA modification GTPase